MNDTSNRSRQPQGVPTGGQFAAESRPEANVSLWDLAPDEREGDGRWSDAHAKAQSNRDMGWASAAYEGPSQRLEDWESEVVASAGMSKDDLATWAGSGKDIVSVAVLHQAGLGPDSTETEQREWARDRFLELAAAVDDRIALVEDDEPFFELFDGDAQAWDTELGELRDWKGRVVAAAQGSAAVDGYQFHSMGADVAEHAALISYDFEADVTPECEAAAKLHR